MKTTRPTHRLALVPAHDGARAREQALAPLQGGVVRRYRLGRVLDDLGPVLACVPEPSGSLVTPRGAAR